MRFRDFLRTAVLLFGGAATALAAISVVGAGRNDDRTLVFVALGWWLLAAVSGLRAVHLHDCPQISEADVRALGETAPSVQVTRSATRPPTL